MHPIQKLLKKNIKFEWTEECNNAFKTAKETLMRDPILYHLDPNTVWIIETDASRTAFAGILLQPHTHYGIKQDLDHHWTSDILTGDPHPTIQYKKGSLNLIADSLSRLRTGDHYKYDVPLHNAKPLVLKEKVEINMVTTRAK